MLRKLSFFLGLSCSGLLPASPARHSLMITDPKILKSPEAEGLGAFSFGGLTYELSKAHLRKSDVSPEEYSAFMRNWLQQFLPSRPGIETWVSCAWAEASRGDAACREAILSPENAPFKLLAISYRPDLADSGCQGQEGEFRFTFGLTKEALNGRKPWEVSATEMTVIFEYALHKALPLERTSQDWAQLLLQLDRPELCKDFCSEYQQELRAFAQSVTRYHENLEGGSALGQIRSNEVVGDPAFNPALTTILRQFGEELSQCYATLVQSPDDFTGGLEHCRDRIRSARLPAGPIQLAALTLDKALAALAAVSKAPVALPLPTALVNAANNALAGIASQLGLWEMREFTLQADGLVSSHLHDTPSSRHNNSSALKAVIQTHAEEILNDTIKVSEIIKAGDLSPTAVAAANPFDPWRLYSLRGADTDIAVDARLHSRFAIKTCQGCHSTQTSSNGLFLVMNDLLLHSSSSRELKPNAARLLRAHQAEELHVANIDAFYLISPLRDPGAHGQDHLAPFLTKKGGHLEKLTARARALAESCELLP